MPRQFTARPQVPVLALLLALALLAASVRAAEPGPLDGEKPASEAFDPDTDPDVQLAMRLERAFQKVAQRVAPSVVSLAVYTKEEDWRESLWRLHEQQGPGIEKRFTGSGVILDAACAILTNEHVVRGAESVRVTLHDGRSFKARVVGADPRSDLAVIRPAEAVDLASLRPATFADSDKVAVGQWAIAVGNPFELSNTLTVGVVSARGRSLPARSFSATDVFYGNLIQTDAAINPGNSGGPLFNLRGELIGINTMIFSKTGKFEGFGFAIPANHVRPRLAYLKQGLPVQYGWLGVLLSDLEPGQKAFNVPDGKGVLVEYVVPDSPADRAGMHKGSVVLSFDGAHVKNTTELIMAVGGASVGQNASVRVISPGGRVEDLSVRVGLRTPDLVRNSRYRPDVETTAEADGPGEFTWRGMQVKELDGEESRKYGGALMVMRVKKGTPADRAGLYEGAILDEIKYGGSERILALKAISDLRRAATDAEGGVYVHVPNGGYLMMDEE